MRAAGLIIGVAVLAFGSVTAAGVTAIDDPAHVDRAAYRIAPPFRQELSGVDRAIAAVVELVNDERSARGLPIMQQHASVGAAAMAHADDMARRRQLVHFGVDGSDTGDRLRREGFVWRTWGEAIGGGFSTPERIVDAWMASDEHRAHILGDNVHVGVGVAVAPDGVPYWVLVVAT